ncbi:hypothetical protein SLEP1_g4625 [Rubroshorea leprosula]|uniref:Uncharacterized protein n=1 Tax=Rubroshorea leprosula TaxID=152421 RepID=A0AAV5HY51_9ROSI|nr:hypothetical protein SLEP1_g4625 [Rubroshorea leprosula]
MSFAFHAVPEKSLFILYPEFGWKMNDTDTWHGMRNHLEIIIWEGKIHTLILRWRTHLKKWHINTSSQNSGAL